MDGFWMNPGGSALEQALDDLGLERQDVEEIPEEHQENVPRNLYPTFDLVMDRAWEIREEEEDR